MWTNSGFTAWKISRVHGSCPTSGVWKYKEWSVWLIQGQRETNTKGEPSMILDYRGKWILFPWDWWEKENSSWFFKARGLRALPKHCKDTDVALRSQDALMSLSSLCAGEGRVRGAAVVRRVAHYRRAPTIWLVSPETTRRGTNKDTSCTGRRSSKSDHRAVIASLRTPAR